MDHWKYQTGHETSHMLWVPICLHIGTHNISHASWACWCSAQFDNAYNYHTFCRADLTGHMALPDHVHSIQPPEGCNIQCCQLKSLSQLVNSHITVWRSGTGNSNGSDTHVRLSRLNWLWHERQSWQSHDKSPLQSLQLSWARTLAKSTLYPALYPAIVFDNEFCWSACQCVGALVLCGNRCTCKTCKQYSADSCCQRCTGLHSQLELGYLDQNVMQKVYSNTKSQEHGKSPFLCSQSKKRYIARMYTGSWRTSRLSIQLTGEGTKPESTKQGSRNTWKVLNVNLAQPSQSHLLLRNIALKLHLCIYEYNSAASFNTTFTLPAS